MNSWAKSDICQRQLYIIAVSVQPLVFLMANLKFTITN